MKKLISLSTILFLGIICIFLSGCQTQIGSNRIELSKENIDQYLKIEINAEPTKIGTYNSPISGSQLLFEEIAVKGTISSIKQVNYENASVKINASIEASGPNTIYGTTDDYTVELTVDLDSNGYGIIDVTEDASDYIGMAKLVDYEIVSVSGYVMD